MPAARFRMISQRLLLLFNTISSRKFFVSNDMEVEKNASHIYHPDTSTPARSAVKLKRILFLVQLPPPVHGASLRNESLLKSVLLNKHFDIRPLPLRFTEELAGIGNFSIGKMFRLAKIYFFFLGECLFHRPDLAYFTLAPTGGAFLRDTIFVFTLKLLGINTMFHLRTMGVGEASKRNAFLKFMYHTTFRNVTVVCLGHNQAHDLRHLPVKKIFVVPDGLQVEVRDEDLRTGKAAPAQPVILFLSNFIRSKGVYDFIDTLKKISDAGLEFTAKMVGADTDVTSHQLKERIDELALAHRVSVLPPVFGNEKFELLLNADIFFFPTYFELFPGVVLEAMQCGKPVLTCRTGCIPEMVDDGQNGLLTNPRSIDEMAAKLQTLLADDTLRTTLGVNGRQKFIRNFTLPTYEQRMKEVLEQG
jgi:glycosyltransferase involved in cell wall biosynthesis